MLPIDQSNSPQTIPINKITRIMTHLGGPMRPFMGSRHRKTRRETTMPAKAAHILPSRQHPHHHAQITSVPDQRGLSPRDDRSGRPRNGEQMQRHVRLYRGCHGIRVDRLRFPQLQVLDDHQQPLLPVSSIRHVQHQG